MKKASTFAVSVVAHCVYTFAMLYHAVNSIFISYSGHGECFNGSCYCQIQFEGAECKRINFSYHVAFASIFFLLALTSLIQLVMCIHAE